MPLSLEWLPDGRGSRIRGQENPGIFGEDESSGRFAARDEPALTTGQADSNPMETDGQF
jgi:hypothetical protein